MHEASLSKGERIILEAQGTLQFGPTWQLGHLFLTDRRLIFIQAKKTILEYRLDKIIGMNIMRRRWMMGIKVKQLHIEFNCGSGREQAYIALAKPGEWIAAIKEGMTLMLFHLRQA